MKQIYFIFPILRREEEKQKKHSLNYAQKNKDRKKVNPVIHKGDSKRWQSNIFEIMFGYYLITKIGEKGVGLL